MDFEPLELKELKRLHDKAYLANQDTRQKASDDLVFYWITQWDDNLLDSSNLEYRGEFNRLRKAGRKILTDLRANPVQVNFEAKNEASGGAAEFLDTLYRADDRSNSSLEAYDFAGQDSVVCGFGAWEIYTEYETNRVGDRNQVIRRRFIPEANNTAFVDPNDHSTDKHNAKYWSLLTAYTEDGYCELVYDLTGEEIDKVAPSNFANPEESLAFPWMSEDRKIYITRFFHKTKITDKVYNLVDPFGKPITLRLSDVEEQMDDLLDAGYEIVAEKEIERDIVTLYIASGERILHVQRVPGEYIPVIPVYGERAIVESQEHWEGVTRLAKDPERLRNFQLSYLADIVSRSPRPKPMFFQEQVQGLERMYEQSGADNNYPYYLLNRTTDNGEPLPVGPVAEMPEQRVPTALLQSISLANDALSDVAEAGTPQNIADPDLSGKAVRLLQAQIDKQSYIYQHNMKFAKRYDGVVYASMASEVYDAPRKVMVETPDGQRKQVEVLQTIMDNETGELVTLNDLTQAEFEVRSDIGPSYDTQKQETVEMLDMMITQLPQGDPMRQMLLLKRLKLAEGVEFDDVRKYANKQLLMMGLREPETDEEIAFMQQQQQAANQPNPQTMLAMAEAEARQKEGTAALQNEVNDANKLQIDAFKAETDRMEAMAKIQESGSKTNKNVAETEGQLLENQQAAAENAEQRVENVMTRPSWFREDIAQQFEQGS